jgi:hypothetical protein
MVAKAAYAVSSSASTEEIIARNLQERMGVLARLALSAPFIICNLQILFARAETDPVSRNQLDSITYETQINLP